ncbi:Nucleolar complex protein 3 [Allomyces javanicus]|nr:Nucleolar complex protein 3 [Allomyces javanicus]
MAKKGAHGAKGGRPAAPRRGGPSTNGKPNTNGQSSKKPADKKKPATSFAVPDTEVDSDILSDEDLQFLEENAEYAQMVAGIDVNAITKKQSKDKVKKQPRPKPAPVAAAASDDDDDDDIDAKIRTSAIVAESSDDDDEIHQDLVEGSEDEDEDGMDADLDATLADTDDDGDMSELDETNIDVDAIPSDIESSDFDSDDENDDIAAASASDDDSSDEDDDLRYIKPLKKTVRAAGSDDEEPDWEKTPRAVKTETTVAKLPIKGADGRVIRVVSDEPVAAVVDDEDEDEAAAAQAKKKPAAPPKPSPHDDLDDDGLHPLERIAQACQRVIEDPESNIGLVQRVHEYLVGRNAKYAKVALVSLLQVYLDVIPGYRIHELTEAQKAEKVSKDVKKLRNFESTLLANYQKYLVALDKKIKEAPAQRSAIRESDMAYLAVTAFCKLLKTHPHFNFRLNILNALSKRLTRTELAGVIVDTLRDVFRRDEEGQVSSEAVRLVAKAIKGGGYRCDPRVVRVFAHLRLKHELTLEDVLKKANRGKPSAEARKAAANAAAKKPTRKGKDQFVNKKQRKAMKRQLEVEKELKESEAVVSLEDRKKHHRVTLEHVFLTYFRILKGAARDSPLIPAVLEGLSLFAHLISIEFFQSLFAVFKSYLADPNVRAASKLRIVSTAHRVLSGQGQLLNLDLADFYGTLYAVLGDLALRAPASLFDDDDAGHGGSNAPTGVDADVHIALEVLDEVLKRKVPQPIVTALFVRLVRVSASATNPGTVMACLATAATMTAKFGFLRTVLDAPSDRPASGRFEPYVDDPQIANAAAATPCDFALLTHHWHPEVRAAATAITHDLSPAALAHTDRARPRLMPWTDCFARWDWRASLQWVPDWDAIEASMAEGPGRKNRRKSPMASAKRGAEDDDGDGKATKRKRREDPLAGLEGLNPHISAKRKRKLSQRNRPKPPSKRKRKNRSA